MISPQKTTPKASKSAPSIEASSSNTSSSRSSIEALGPYDILVGRHRIAYNNIGNRRFRVTITMNLQAYLAARTKGEKSELIRYIVRFLKDDAGARFVKLTKGRGYVELGEEKARQKVGHALRDLAVTQNQSTMTEWTENLKRKEPLSSESSALKGRPKKRPSYEKSKSEQNESPRPLVAVSGIPDLQIVKWRPMEADDDSSTHSSLGSILTAALPGDHVISSSFFDDEHCWSI